MNSFLRPYVGAFLSLTTVIAPAALASSSTAGVAQTATVSSTIPPAILLPQAPVVDVAPEAPAETQPAVVQAVSPDRPQPDPRHVACVAKIIMHEAAYEPRPGRVAVAQVIRARIRDGRFAADACGVARQRGQFFDVDAFRPSQSSSAWADAVAIAAEALRGEGPELVPGALFFHASYSPMPGRVRVGRIGGHIFYR